MARARRDRFIQEYLVDLNATKAARRAGYKQPHVQGSRLLSHPAVTHRLQEEQSQRTLQHRISAAEVVSLLEREATDPSNNGSTRVRALELLGKHLGIFSPRQVEIESNRFLFVDV